LPRPPDPWRLPGSGHLGDRACRLRRVRGALAVPVAAAQPHLVDLGIYTEYVKQYAHLKAPIVDIRAAGFNCSAITSADRGAHCPVRPRFPLGATLLVAQALLVAVSVFGVSQLAREKLGVGPGRAIALAYGFCWACSR